MKAPNSVPPSGRGAWPTPAGLGSRLCSQAWLLRQAHLFEQASELLGHEARIWSGQGELNPRLIRGRDECHHNTLAA